MQLYNQDISIKNMKNDLKIFYPKNTKIATFLKSNFPYSFIL